MSSQRCDQAGVLRRRIVVSAATVPRPEIPSTVVTYTIAIVPPPPIRTALLRTLQIAMPLSELNLDSVVSRLRRRKLCGSFQVASETALLCRQIVSVQRWTHIDQLLAHLKQVGKSLVEAQPREFTSGNIVRRVLKMIREVHADSMAGNLDHGDGDVDEDRRPPPATGLADSQRVNVAVDPTTSIHSAMLNLLGRPENANLLSTETKTSGETSSAGANLRPAIIAGIQDIMDELTRIYKDIGPHSLQQIHSSEIILTHGSSKTVASFLKQAAESRRFTVIVTESYPNGISGAYSMAEEIAAAGINTVAVPDSAVFGLMSRVNKVIMGTHAVLQNGGLLAAAGAKQVALAARAHATPVVIVTGVYKLTPFYPYDHEELIELITPEKVSSFKDVLSNSDVVDVLNPYYDYVEPELVALYITNLGAHAPTTLHRVMAENYDNEDYTF